MLYSYWRSSCSYRVRIALALKGIDYEYRAVNLAAKGGGEQHQTEYERLNPMKAVPTLLIDGAAIGQSVAILEYLEETRPEPALLPAAGQGATAAVQRAKVRQLVSIICADTQPLQNSSVLAAIAGDDEEGKAAFARKWIERGLRAYEKTIETTAGRYSVGDEVTLADLALVPQLYNARRFGIDVTTAFPALARIDEALQQLPAFRAAHPDAQIDAPASQQQGPQC